MIGSTLELGSRSPGKGSPACNLRTFEVVKMERVSMEIDLDERMIDSQRTHRSRRLRKS